MPEKFEIMTTVVGRMVTPTIRKPLRNLAQMK